MGQGANTLTEELISRARWSDADLESAEIECVDVPFVTIGGGLGSLVLVDLLRISGMSTGEIKVLSRTKTSFSRYKNLASASQISDTDRLRSDSSAMPDNAWGFPSYALVEARKGNLGAVWKVVAEPLASEVFTPLSGQVFTAIEREAERIGWKEMVDRTEVRLVRPRIGGGYFVLARRLKRDSVGERIAYRSRYVHLAPGYAGAQFLPDLQEFRQRTKDLSRVVNAYQPHDHLYDLPKSTHRVVVVRGSGIVASRVLERLLSVAENGGDVTVIHLFRQIPTEATTRPRQKVLHGFTLQPFNLAKSAFGGGLAEYYESIRNPEERAAAIRVSAGTTTAFRSAWFDQIERCLRSGVYQQLEGEVKTINEVDDGIRIDLACSTGEDKVVAADFIVDATGLIGGATDHRILRDLVDNLGVPLNPMGRITTSKTFEIESIVSPPGRAFISGAMAMGNYFGPVDSFYGLQYAAWRILDQMSADDFVPRLGTTRSVLGWFKRLRGVSP